MALTICVLLWAAPGQEHRLAEYEDRVLERLGDYQARLLIRVRATAGQGDVPAEVQVLEFPSQSALDAFQRDPQRLALAKLREQAIARTEIIRVEDVSPPAA